jgi:spore coat protein U-like protein
MKRWLSNALAVLALSSSTLLGGSARAATDTKTFDVTAVVDARCSIDAVNVDFGVYDVFAMVDKTTSGSVTVRCTKGASVRIDLDDGMNGPSRKMSNGSATLDYELYSDVPMATRWGAGASGINPYAPSPTSTSTAAAATTVYAKLPQGQTGATPGNYSDTVTATVNF